MSRAIKLALLPIVACIFQTNLARLFRFAGVAPDMIIVFLVVLTSYTGAYGGLCLGALTAMFYDASVGYVLAINLVAYTLIGWSSVMMRGFLDEKLQKLKHKSVLVMMLICFSLTLMREILYIGYLFLIGSDQSVITLLRALICAAYSALLVIPGSLLLRKFMNWRPFKRRTKEDLVDEATAHNPS